MGENTGDSYEIIVDAKGGKQISFGKKSGKGLLKDYVSEGNAIDAQSDVRE
jgi:hypothetical protein